jgi:protein MpaA
MAATEAPGRQRGHRGATGRRRWRSPALVVLLTLVCGLLPGAAPAGAAAVRSETVTIGESVKGQRLVAYHRWRPGATKRVLVVGTMHGDEPAGRRVVALLRTMSLPANVDLWMVANLNPDGRAKKRRTNAHGVDLNRNFPHVWRLADRGTRKYSGPKAASEPETQALIALVKQVRPRTTIVFHQPLYGVDSYRAKSMPLVRALSRETGLPIRRFACGSFCHGTFTGWHNRRTTGRAVTVEFDRAPSRAPPGPSCAWAPPTDPTGLPRPPSTTGLLRLPSEAPPPPPVASTPWERLQACVWTMSRTPQGPGS